MSLMKDSECCLGATQKLSPNGLSIYATSCAIGEQPAGYVGKLSYFSISYCFRYISGNFSGNFSGKILSICRGQLLVVVDNVEVYLTNILDYFIIQVALLVGYVRIHSIV